MTTVDAPTPDSGGSTSGLNYLNCAHGIMSWLGTLDHKRIGIMYLVSVLSCFFLAGMLALVIRTELIWPGETIVDP
ncbi:MAG: cytochrome c oxidase subunit I, partial [Planctomycetota bacterium]